MRQGRASRDRPEGRKVEPTPRAIRPAAVAQFGLSQGNHAMTGDTGYRGEKYSRMPGYRPRLGPDYAAPSDEGKSVKRGGSQGRY